MQPNRDDISDNGKGNRRLRADNRSPGIVYIGPGRAFSECLIRNLTFEFPEFKFHRLSDFAEARQWCAETDDDARLVLVDDSLCESLRTETDDFGRMFPDQVICISLNHTEPPSQCAAELHGLGTVRSFLPMHLRLDIWLSAIRLMLSGGDYCPPDVMENMMKRSARYEPAAKPPRRGGGKGAGPSRAQGLTAREVQVMELASQGYQNKNIAEKLGLSEHTVKLHMHNIISKLGASNRTEAAGIFLDRLSTGNPPGSGLN
ncbi:MAG: response regulator transcription factor [Oricola sp.]